MAYFRLTFPVGIDPEITTRVRKQLMTALIDIAHLIIMLRTMPLKDAFVKGFQISQLGKDQVALYEDMCEDIPQLLQYTIRWVSSKLCILFKPDGNELNEILLKLLFIEKRPSEFDNYPPEIERMAIHQIISAQNVLEGTLTRLTIIGGEYLKGFDRGLDIFWSVVSRCCKNGGKIKIENAKQLAENILGLISSPDRSTSTRTMWRGWLTFLLLAASNPCTIGAYGWEAFPQLRLFISYCITGTVILTDEQKQAARRLEQNEKDEILRKNPNIDVSELCTFSSGDLRIPPGSIISEIDALNKSIGLDTMLSENRNPDFLLLLMKLQSTSLEWLTRLVRSTKDFDQLPIEVRAEYIINVIDQKSHTQNDTQILVALQAICTEGDEEQKVNLLEHIVSRLSIRNSKTRKNAYHLLRVILKTDTVMDVDEPKFEDLINVDNVDFGQLIERLLPLLENSDKALESIIGAFSVETNLDKVYVFLNLIEFTAEHIKGTDINRAKEVITKTALAICELLTSQPRWITTRLRAESTTTNGNNAIDYMATCLKKLTDRMNDSEDLFLTAECPYVKKLQSTVHYKRGGQMRSIPAEFLHAILMLQSCKKDSQLSEAWFDATGNSFISKLADALGPLPPNLVDFLLGSRTDHMLTLAVASIKPAVLAESVSSWMSQESNGVDIVTELLDKHCLEDKVKPNKLLERRLEIHIEGGGKHGQQYLDSLKRHSQHSDQRVETMESSDSIVQSQKPSGSCTELIEKVFSGQSKVESQRMLRRALEIMKSGDIEPLTNLLKPKIEANVKSEQFSIAQILKCMIRKAEAGEKSKVQNLIDASRSPRLKVLQTSDREMSDSTKTVKETVDKYRETPVEIASAVRKVLESRNKAEKIEMVADAIQHEKNERNQV